ncbi:CoA-binding protein [Niveispirillum fermenti]|uniref:CoA-binding protein n=1 Tax=Niveispirillum fermenti TaxID=1233113 RepID=UPI003A89AD61
MQHDFYPDEFIRGVLNAVKTIAVVGATDNPVRASFYVMKYMADKGYRMIPVNPALAGKSVLGQPAYASLTDLPEKPDMVDIFRNTAEAGRVAEEAAAMGIPYIWMQLGIRNDEAAARAETAGATVIMNRCPKIEYARLYGEIGRQGVNSNIITAKRRPVKPAKKLM